MARRLASKSCVSRAMTGPWLRRAHSFRKRRTSSATMASAGATCWRRSCRVWSRMRQVALSIVRCPDGAEAKCFYQRHSLMGASPGRLKEVKRPGSKRGAYIYVDSLEAASLSI